MNDIYLLWQQYTYLYNLVSRSSPSLFDPETFSTINHIRTKFPLVKTNTNPVEIIITDENNVHLSHWNSMYLDPNFNVNSKCAKISNDDDTSHTVYDKNAVCNESIIADTKKNNSDNDVSVTICLPLRRKSRKSIDVHEEIILSNIHATITKHEISNYTTQLNQSFSGSPLESENDKDHKEDHGETVSTPDNADVVSVSSTESNSIDFWKEIIDNEEDLLFGYKHANHMQQNTDEPKTVSEKEYTQTCKDITLNWRVSSNIKNFSEHTSMSEESFISSECDDSNSTNQKHNGSSVSETNESNNNSKSESSEENDDDYNVYEFLQDNGSQYKVDNQIILDADTTCQNEEIVLSENEVNNEKQPVYTRDFLQQTPKRHFTNDTSDLEEDSGINSDVGKYVSETDVTTEQEISNSLRKLSKYERAATHSRLYRLLMTEEKVSNMIEESEVPTNITTRKESLTLPLVNNLESASSSSGINSPISLIINEKLTDELVENLLTWKKSTAFRKLSPKKLREAAIESLQTDTICTNRLVSPQDSIKFCAEERTLSFDNSTHHESIRHDNSLYYPGFDICPSKTFKYLQSGRSTPSTWPKCPLVSNQTKSHKSLPKLTKSQDET